MTMNSTGRPTSLSAVDSAATATTVSGSKGLLQTEQLIFEIGSADTNNVAGAAASLPYASALPTTYSPQPGASTTSDRINLYLQVQP